MISLAQSPNAERRMMLGLTRAATCRRSSSRCLLSSFLRRPFAPTRRIPYPVEELARRRRRSPVTPCYRHTPYRGVCACNKQRGRCCYRRCYTPLSRVTGHQQKSSRIRKKPWVCSSFLMRLHAVRSAPEPASAVTPLVTSSFLKCVTEVIGEAG